MNADGDHSAAYVMLHTDDPDLTGFGLTFTIGRGTDLCVAAAQQLADPLVGLDVDDLLPGGLGAAYRRIVGDSQMRWLGPEKGVVALATAAVMNALWDLAARRAGKPLWRLLCDMPPAELVAACDFRYLSDVLTPAAAVEMLQRLEPTREQRVAELRRDGYPAYTSGPGWLGYSDDKLRRLCREAVAGGWHAIKLKVGANLDDDLRRCAIARVELGPTGTLMIDANQVWDVEQAIDWVRALRRFEPIWIEEPTSPDDVVGHAAIRRAVAPVGVATGEHAHNRVMFKQFLQLSALDYCQIDSCRLASINEIVPVLLMAAKHGVPVCPHAGGVGLCEIVQHLSMFDFAALSGTTQGRQLEWIDHLHEHFAAPAVVTGGRYRAPRTPGASTEILPESLAEYSYPSGPAWRGGGMP